MGLVLLTCHPNRENVIAKAWQIETGRNEERARRGVFLGWRFNTGYSWAKRTYLVVDLSDFLRCNLHRRAQIEHLKVHVQETTEIVNFDPSKKPDFPLNAQYDWFNSTFEGNLIAMAMDPGIFN